MKLFFAPGACSLAVHITALEAGLDLELVKVDLATHTLPDGKDFHTINPRGYVPALKLDDDTVLTEVSAVVQYLGDLKPSKGLTVQAGTLGRVRLQEWLSFIGSELHKTYGLLWARDTHESTKKIAHDRLSVRFDELDRLLSTKPYLMGDVFTVADAYAFTVLGWSNMVGVSLNRHPALGSYLGRVSTRPAVRRALQNEGLMKAGA
jgi:glutathione S-transferase